jgi:hypothetical protein
VYVGEISGKKMCVDGCGRREILEILRDSSHAALANVCISFLDV